MGFIKAAVNELMFQSIDWSAAHSLDANDFVEYFIDDIRWMLGLGEEDGRQVAVKLWRGLRE